MLTFRNSIISFVIVALMLVALKAGIAAWLLLLLLHAGLIGYGSARIESSFFIKTICTTKHSEKEIVITFDDGPTELTAKLLDVLKQHEVPATFFCIGQNVIKRPELVQRAYREKHIIANHTFSHSFTFDSFSTNNFYSELIDTENAIKKLITRSPLFFRPPYGVTTPGLAYAIMQAGYSCIGWNVRTLDTVIKDKQQLLTRTLKALKPGAIFLFHDSAVVTTEMLDEFITQVKTKGYKIIALDQLLKTNSYA